MDNIAERLKELDRIKSELDVNLGKMEMLHRILRWASIYQCDMTPAAKSALLDIAAETREEINAPSLDR